MTGIDRLLALANAYATAESIELSTVSWRVFGDTKKLAALVDGGDIQVKRYERALVWFAENWPDGAQWPKVVSRPRAQAA